jgi:hypothetical protein
VFCQTSEKKKQVFYFNPTVISPIEIGQNCLAIGHPELQVFYCDHGIKKKDTADGMKENPRRNRSTQTN